jgi:general secretion pathway protein E
MTPGRMLKEPDEMIDGLASFPLERIRAAREEAFRTKRGIVEVLEQQAGLPQPVFISTLAVTFNYLCLSKEELVRLTPDFQLIAYAEAIEQGCVAVRDVDHNLMIVFYDPFASDRRCWLDERITDPFTMYLVHHEEFAAYLAQYEKSLRAMDGLVSGPNHEERVLGAVAELSIQSISGDTSPVVKLVHSTLYDALKGGASDIHLETGAGGLKIKYRIDGVLMPVGSVEGLDIAEQIISRIKVMADLDIGERRVPQDGRFKVSIQGRAVDFRVSVIPSIHGEDSVIRILDKQTLSDRILGLRLESLAFDQDSITHLRRLATEPYGMMLVTGPTGSGKTTTLYAVLTEINNGRDKIITIEDPVEYQLPGVLQIPVNEKKGLTFSRGLRSILRHDPDKIMVGEIRDSETAQIAVQSALTGHLVFATVHANNALDIIARFIHMGVDPYNFVSALNGVVAQRLIRLVCPQCGESDDPSIKTLAASRLTMETCRSFTFRVGRGCQACLGSGYKGRRAITEILHLDDEIRELIVAKEPIRRIKDAARAKGMRFLREAALDLVKNGESTLEEINRVTFMA